MMECPDPECPECKAMRATALEIQRRKPGPSRPPEFGGVSRAIPLRFEPVPGKSGLVLPKPANP